MNSRILKLKFDVSFWKQKLCKIISGELGKISRPRFLIHPVNCWMKGKSDIKTILNYFLYIDSVDVNVVLYLVS